MVEPVGPLGLKQHTLHRRGGEFVMAVKGKRGALPRFEVVASQAFYKLPMSFLKQLATHYHVDRDVSIALWAVLRVFVTKWAKAATDVNEWQSWLRGWWVRRQIQQLWMTISMALLWRKTLGADRQSAA